MSTKAEIEITNLPKAELMESTEPLDYGAWITP